MFGLFKKKEAPQFFDIYQSANFDAKAVDRYESYNQHHNVDMVMLMPTRGLLPIQVVRSWDAMILPMNQKRYKFDMVGKEVGEAYQILFEHWLSHPELTRVPWAFTYEEDNVLPRETIVELFAAIFKCVDCGKKINERTWLCPNGHHGLDAVSGLYWTKSEPGAPMAFGNPEDPNDFRPQSVKDAIAEGKVIEVNGIAMGCTLYRRELFEQVEMPWFKTGNGTSDDDPKITQDLYFCKKAKAVGARFGVHCGLKVGHYDIRTGVTY